jgi:hypothetical protein
MAEQVQGLSSKDRRHFGRFAPAFVIGLLSASDNLSEARQKMEVWLANGGQLGWLIDPYRRNVWIYEAGKQVRIETGDSVAGTGSVEGVVLELADVESVPRLKLAGQTLIRPRLRGQRRQWSKRLIIRNGEIRASAG